MDKRILRDRAAALRKELEAVRGHRAAYRKRRAVAPIPVVALVGYTNAGARAHWCRLACCRFALGRTLRASWWATPCQGTAPSCK